MSFLELKDHNICSSVVSWGDILCDKRIKTFGDGHIWDIQSHKSRIFFPAGPSLTFLGKMPHHSNPLVRVALVALVALVGRARGDRAAPGGAGRGVGSESHRGGRSGGLDQGARGGWLDVAGGWMWLVVNWVQRLGTTSSWAQRFGEIGVVGEGQAMSKFV